MRAPAEESSIRPGRILLMAALAGAVLAPATLGAQSGPTLTLGDALARAERYNPDYRMARNDMELNTTAKRQARLRRSRGRRGRSAG